MAFTPENDLERAMLNAAADDSVRPAFYRLLLDSELVVLGTFGSTMTLDAVRGPAGEFHPVFTSPARVKAIAPEMPAHFTIQGRKLFEITRGAQFVVNPGSNPDKIMVPDEIAWCLQNFQPQPHLIVAEPKVYPVRLVKALCVLFTSRAAIKAAHLVFVAREGIDSEAHPLIGLEADGDVERLVQEIFAAAEAVLPGKPVEVVYLDAKSASHPLQKHLLSVPPFYSRALLPN